MRVFIAGITLSALVAAADAQVWQWRPPAWPSGVGMRMAFDDVRQRTVLFARESGGTRGASLGLLWEWDGAIWLPRHTTTAPMWPEAMAFDSHRQRIVMLSDGTWEYDGFDWRRIVADGAAGAPCRREGHGMTYDPVRNCVVLFGGRRQNVAVYGDTWTWNGSTWTQLSPQNPPIARWDHGMTFDHGRGVVLMFGGTNLGTDITTFTFDGTRWRAPFVATTPPPLRSIRMAYDVISDEVVMTGSVVPAVEWRWNGSDWREVTTNLPDPVAVADIHRAPNDELLLMDRQWPDQPGNTWRHDGTSWRLAAPLADAGADLHVPLPSGGTLAMTRHMGMSWHHFRGQFRALGMAGAPTNRRALRAIAFDATRGHVLGFGRGFGRVPLPETWTFDGSRWQQIHTVTTPDLPGTSSGGDPVLHSGFDATRGEVVLLVGQMSIGSPMTTWSWDGVDWRRGPSAPFVTEHLHHDSARNVLLAIERFTGRVAEWDGSAWTVSMPANPRGGLFAWSPPHQAVVNASAAGMARWTGADWTPLAVPGPPPELFPARAPSILYYDPVLQELTIMISGRCGSWVLADTPRTVQSFGSGCGLAAPPQLGIAGSLWLGASWQVHMRGDSSTGLWLLAGSYNNANIDLGAGCRQLVASPFILGAASGQPSGNAALSLRLPTLPALLDVPIVLQAIGLVQGGPALGVAELTNGVTARISR